MKIHFSTVDTFEGWNLAQEAFGSMIVQTGSKQVLEIGSGANPTLPVSFVRDKRISYTTNDIDQTELSKADPEYIQLCCDFSKSEVPKNLAGQFDFVFSRMVNEHVRDGECYYKNIHAVLKPNGITSHCFSTLYTLPFIANRWMPDFVSDLLLEYFAPRDRIHHGKFKAYYSWGRGPTSQMLKRFDSIGFEVLEYAGYFGHSYYKGRLPWLHWLETKKSIVLTKYPIPLATSYAKVVLRKKPAN